MFHIELPRPIYLISELAPVIKASGIELDALTDVLKGRCFVIAKSEKGYHRGAVISAELLTHIPEVLTSTSQEGLDIICEENHAKPRMLEKIDLPSDVYASTDSELWPDVEHLIWGVASESERIRSLMALNVPQIIYQNELRMLWQKVEMLAGEIDAPSDHGKKSTSLKTIGYSLMNGWSKAVTEKRMRELEEAMEKYNKENEEEK